MLLLVRGSGSPYTNENEGNVTSVEFNEIEDYEIQSQSWRQVLIRLARTAGIEPPVQAAIDAEDVLDGLPRLTLIREYGWTPGRFMAASALRVLYENEGQPPQEYELEDDAPNHAADSNPVPSSRIDNDTQSLLRPMENLFRNILDTQQRSALAGFSEPQIDHLVLEMGKIYSEHANSQKLINRHTSHMRQMLRGVTPREIAANENRTESAIYSVFLYKLPSLYRPHRDRIIEVFERISQMPSDIDGPGADELLFVETAPRARTPIRTVPRPKPVPRPAPQRRTRARVSETPVSARRASLPKAPVPPRPSTDKDRSSSIDQGFSDLDSIGFYMKQAGRTPLLKAEQEVELAKDIEAGLYAAQKLVWLLGEENEQFGERRGWMPSEEELSDLQKMARRGEQAKNHMLEANLRLVISLAKRYTGRGMGFQDLIQEGNVGLIRAMEKFDYTKGFKFSTYATWWIRQAITRGMADQARTIRLPVHMIEHVIKLAKIKRELHQDLGREATDGELAAESGLPVDKVREFLGHMRGTVSLDLPIGLDETPFGDFIEDRGSTDAFTNFEFKESLKDVLSTLDEREQLIIRLRFGLDDGQPRTLKQVGELSGLSGARVHQLEGEAMSKLRNGEYADLLRELID